MGDGRYDALGGKSEIGSARVAYMEAIFYGCYNARQ